MANVNINGQGQFDPLLANPPFQSIFYKIWYVATLFSFVVRYSQISLFMFNRAGHFVGINYYFHNFKSFYVKSKTKTDFQLKGIYLVPLIFSKRFQSKFWHFCIGNHFLAIFCMRGSNFCHFCIRGSTFWPFLYMWEGSKQQSMLY